jgi:hypothetical protein
VAYLGHEGIGPNWPYEIDTIQTFQNVPAPAPDSDTRIDAEFMNDVLMTLRTLELIIGTQPQGSFASVAARLNFYLPDTGLPTNIVGFVNETVVSVPGLQHQLGTSQLVWTLWDANVPRAAVQPQSLSVDPVSFDVVMTFAAGQSGTLVLDAPPSRYQASFTNTNSFTVLGATHGLGTADLFWALYDTTSTPHQTFEPEQLSIHPSTFDVSVTFPTGILRTGRLVLTPGRTPHVTSFTSQTLVQVLGSTHNLGMAGLLAQVVNAGTPRQWIQPGSLTVDPTTFTVELGFAVAQSGRLLLAAAATPPTTALARPAPQWAGRRIGPHDPVPVLQRTVQALEARLLALEEAHLALLAQMTPPGSEDPTA